MLIAFEGYNKEQVELLAEKLNAEILIFPDLTTQTGELIKECKNLSDIRYNLLMITNRYEKESYIKELLNMNKNVIICYNEFYIIESEWHKNITKNIIEPDYNFNYNMNAIDCYNIINGNQILKRILSTRILNYEILKHLEFKDFKSLLYVNKDIGKTSQNNLILAVQNNIYKFTTRQLSDSQNKKLWDCIYDMDINKIWWFSTYKYLVLTNKMPLIKSDILLCDMLNSMVNFIFEYDKLYGYVYIVKKLYEKNEIENLKRVLLRIYELTDKLFLNYVENISTVLYNKLNKTDIISAINNL